MTNYSIKHFFSYRLNCFTSKYDCNNNLHVSHMIQIDRRPEHTVLIV